MGQQCLGWLRSGRTRGKSARLREAEIGTRWWQALKDLPTPLRGGGADLYSFVG